jgi:hypothetical protein
VASVQLSETEFDSCLAHLGTSMVLSINAIRSTMPERRAYPAEKGAYARESHSLGKRGAKSNLLLERCAQELCEPMELIRRSVDKTSRSARLYGKDSVLPVNGI